MFRLGLVALVSCALSGAAQAQTYTVYGLSNGFGTAAETQVYQIDPATGTVSSAMAVTIPGLSVGRALGLAAEPGTGTLYAILQTNVVDTNTNRRLATINPATGVATTVGMLGDGFSSLAFRADGTLYGVTGDGALTPETLFTINKTTAVPTLAFALGNGLDGETIAFHANGLLYHSSGNGTALFESVNVTTQAVTPIGSAAGEMFAMGYSPESGLLLGSDIFNTLFSIDIATGVRTEIGFIDGPGANRGVAFVPVPEPGSVLGAASLAAALVALRRRAVQGRTGGGRDPHGPRAE